MINSWSGWPTISKTIREKLLETELWGYKGQKSYSHIIPIREVSKMVRNQVAPCLFLANLSISIYHTVSRLTQPSLGIAIRFYS